MGITADSLQKLGLIDEILPEPLGGAHRDPQAMAKTLKASLLSALDALGSVPVDQLTEARYARLMQYGKFEEA